MFSATLETIDMASQQVSWFRRDFQEFLLNENSSKPQSGWNCDTIFYKNIYGSKNDCVYMETYMNSSDLMSMKKKMGECIVDATELSGV